MADGFHVGFNRPVNTALNYSQGGKENGSVPESGSVPFAAGMGGEAIPVSGAKKQENSGAGKDGDRFDRYECQTCKNRKYQDGSDDPGVSFKTPTALSPDEAPAAVRSHENEHVTRERASAAREGREVVSQSVSYHTAVCPECGRVYMSGGTTRTVTKKQVDQAYGLEADEKGKYLDKTA